MAADGGGTFEWIFKPPNNTTVKIFLFKINLLLPDCNWKQRNVYNQLPNMAKGSNQITQKANPTCRIFGPKKDYDFAFCFPVSPAPMALYLTISKRLVN